MKVYVINLDKDAHKLASVDDQLKRLGIEYERVPGVYGKCLPKDVFGRSVNYFRWWCAIGRPIVPAEVGCALSHYGIYDRMNEQDVICILEDDVVLDDAFKTRLDEVEHFIDIAKPQVIMLSSHNCERSGAGICRSTAAICTDGYVITGLAAKALLKANLPMQVPCDHWRRWASKGVIELYHALPTVVRQNQEEFGTSTQANAIAVSSYPLPKWMVHKCKRVIGKAIDGLLRSVGK